MSNLENAAEVPRDFGKSLCACVPCRLIKTFDQVNGMDWRRNSKELSFYLYIWYQTNLSTSQLSLLYSFLATGIHHLKCMKFYCPCLRLNGLLKWVWQRHPCLSEARLTSCQLWLCGAVFGHRMWKLSIPHDGWRPRTMYRLHDCQFFWNRCGYGSNCILGSKMVAYKSAPNLPYPPWRVL